MKIYIGITVLLTATLASFTVHAQVSKSQILKFVGTTDGVYTFQLEATELRAKCVHSNRYKGDGTNSDYIHPVPCVFNTPPGTTYTHVDDITKYQAGGVNFDMTKTDSGESRLTLTYFGHRILHMQIGDVVLPEHDIMFRVLSTKHLKK
jgi:hypothetical protein